MRRQLREHLAPLAQGGLDGLRVGVILVHRRIPDPDVQAVGIGEPGHALHHLHRRPREVRAVGIVVRAGRNQLDGIAAEDRQVAEVLLPDRQVPGVVGIGLGAVAELVAAQRILGGGGQDPGRPAGSRCPAPFAARGADSRRRTAPRAHRCREPPPPDSSPPSGRTAGNPPLPLAAGADCNPSACGPVKSRSADLSPTAITGTFVAGHAVICGQRIRVRFSASSTSIFTACLCLGEASGAQTTTALRKSSARLGIAQPRQAVRPTSARGAMQPTGCSRKRRRARDLSTRQPESELLQPTGCAPASGADCGRGLPTW